MSGYNFTKNIVFFCLKIFFTFSNNVDPNEMQQYAAFSFGSSLFGIHLGVFRIYHRQIYSMYYVIMTYYQILYLKVNKKNLVDVFFLRLLLLLLLSLLLLLISFLLLLSLLSLL